MRELKNKNHYAIAAQSIRTLIRMVEFGHPDTNIVPPSPMFVRYWNKMIGEKLGMARIEPYSPYAQIMSGPVQHQVVVGGEGGDLVLYISRVPYEHVSPYSSCAGRE